MPVPYMEAFVDSRNGTGFSVLGPCPGCEKWTLEYDHTVIGSSLSEFSLGEFHAAVEALLREHLAECVELQGFMATL